MALIATKQRTGSQKTWADYTFSTNTDGVTGADVVDMSGLCFSGMHLSTLVSTACTYTFKGSVDSSGTLGQIVSSTGGVVSYGTTLADPRGVCIAFDPAIWVGIRYIQIISNTTSAPNPNATGATAKVIGSLYGVLD